MSTIDPFNQRASRRRFLGFGAIGLGALAATVMGCGSGDSETGTPVATPPATSGATAGTAATATSTVTAAASTANGQASAKALAAAEAFIATLDASQKAVVVAERTQANLSQWSNLPEQAFQRAGIRLDSLSPDQKTAVNGILAAALSPEGLTQVTQITTADGVLATTSTGSNPGFGADKYWIRFIGTPSANAPWTIQYGGHHLAVNVTVAGARMTHAPTLWGAQPALYSQGGTSVEPLSGETTKAFALMNALDATQQTAATLTTQVREIMLGAGQDGKTLAAEGVKSSTFTAAQKQALLALVQEWLRPLNEENAAAKVTTAEAEVDQMTFAWNGATTIGQPIYYRVQSPTFVIEFAHQRQGNSGDVSHIHSIYREIGNDYGAKLA